MDMFTNENSLTNPNEITVPNGVQKVSRQELINALMEDDDDVNVLKEAFFNFIQKQRLSNDKRYPIITTGKVENINENGKIVVKMVGDDSEVTESVGYLNETPFTVNKNDYVKVCKQTAGDSVNSWIMGVNNLGNKKDAFVYIDDCFHYILQLQEQIDCLKQSIKTMSEIYVSKPNSDGTTTTQINGSKRNTALNWLKKVVSISDFVKNKKQELEIINRGKDNK
jgi:hypothetical protein